MTKRTTSHPEKPAAPGLPRRPRDEDLDLSDIPEVTDFSKGVRGKDHRDPYDPALPDRPVERVVGDTVDYTPARQRGPDYRYHLGRMHDALEDIAALGDPAQPLSVKAAAIARAALEAVERMPVPDDPAYADDAP